MLKEKFKKQWTCLLVKILSLGGGAASSGF